jgi:hypothetical protein
MQVGVRYSFKANRVLELNTAGPEMAQFHLLGIPGVPRRRIGPSQFASRNGKSSGTPAGLSPALRTPGGKVLSSRASLMATNSRNCEYRFKNLTRFRRLNLLLSGHYLHNPLGQAWNFIDFGLKQP